MYLGHSTPDMFGLPHPELADIRLGLSVGRPIIADMFVLASNLAAITPVAKGNVDNKGFHLFHT